MGKVFNATHADKATAMKLADGYAMRHRGVTCYTPAKQYKKRPCTFDKKTGLWTCWSAAHEQRGSCGKHEIFVDQGPDGPVTTDGPEPNPKSMVPEKYADAAEEDYVEEEAQQKADTGNFMIAMKSGAVITLNNVTLETVSTNGKAPEFVFRRKGQIVNLANATGTLTVEDVRGFTARVDAVFVLP